MSLQPDFCFHVSSLGKVDESAKVIRGVSLMTGDLEAEGHNLHVDDTTLSQVFGLAAKLKKVTVKVDHRGPDGKTFQAIAGYLTNFRTEGNKVRGDLELLHSGPLTQQILEMAKRMPENFGLSAAFKGKGEKKGTKEFARCTKLLSVDLVENPAANPDGLFSSGPVDSGKRGMPDNDPNNNTPGAEPTLADVLAAINQTNQNLAGLAERLEGVEAFQNQVIDELANDGDLLDPNDDPNNPEGDQGEGEGEGQGAPAVGAAAAPAAAGAALSAKAVQDLVQLEVGRWKKQALAAEEEQEVLRSFAVIEEKVTALAEQNEDLVKQLAAKDEEMKTLRLAVRTGVKPAGVGGDATLFTAKSAPDGTYESIVTHKFEELRKKTGYTDIKAQSEAVSFAIRTNPEAYKEYRARGGQIQLAAK